jgi:hypothetical protein
LTGSEYGYRFAVVYASWIHMSCPSMTAAYGSPSYLRKGAGFGMRCSIER